MLSYKSDYHLRGWGTYVMCVECFHLFTIPEALLQHIECHHKVGGKNAGMITDEAAVTALKAKWVKDALSDR